MNKSANSRPNRILVKYYDPWTKDILMKADYYFDPKLASHSCYSRAVKRGITFLTGARKPMVSITFK